MDTAYSITLLVAGFAAGGAVAIASFVLVRERALPRRKAGATGVSVRTRFRSAWTGLFCIAAGSGLVSMVIHSFFGHTPGTERELEFFSFLGHHPAYLVIASLLIAAAVLFRLAFRGSIENSRV